MSKNKTHRDLRLDETIGSVGPSKLADTRKTIHEEIRDAQAKVKADAEAKDEAEDEAEDEATSPVSAAEDARLVKLDLITDIQLILVGRFQRLFTVLVGTAIVMFLCLVALVVGVIAGIDISTQVADLVSKQESMLAKQETLVQSAEDTQDKVDETATKVDETKKKVDEAVEAAPKIEVDPDTGKTKVVIPIKRADPPDGDAKDQKTPKPKHTKEQTEGKEPQPPAPKSVGFPVDLK